MERVAFLIEATGERIACLLNPETLVQRRTAGLRTRSAATGVISGAGLGDDPVVATGGGVTEFDLDLLFDTDLARDELQATGRFAPQDQKVPADLPAYIDQPQNAAVAQEMDVRELTRPFWALAENAASDRGYAAPPVVRMIWGRAWNVPGVVTAVAERLERFSASGVPGRSWLRMRLRRVAESESTPPLPPPVTPQYELPLLTPGEESGDAAVALTVAGDGLPAYRLDQLAAEQYGDPGAWRLIAEANGIDDPLDLEVGTVVRLPGVATVSP
jgi:hypothetical protein